MNKSKIEWCDYTWNPVTGCLHGCEYCYARRIAERFDGHMSTIGTTIIHDFKEPYKNEFGKIMPYPCGFEPTFHKYRLDEPKLKTKGRKIFVCSMADLFGEWVPDEWIKEVFKACEAAPQHKYMFLTKNPKRYIESAPLWQSYHGRLQNMWFGTTVTSNADVKRACELSKLPKQINTFLSIEPLLGKIQINRLLKWPVCKYWGPDGNPNEFGKYQWRKQALISTDWVGVKWVILGAQTGPGSVPPKEEWVQDIIDQCRAADVPVFLKDNLKWPEVIKEYPKGMEE